MYSSDTQQAVINSTINQLYILKNASDSKSALTEHSINYNQKEKILLVEGKSDISFWERILSNTVFISDVTNYANSVCKLLNKRPNNKITVVEICKAFNSQEKYQSLPQTDTWEIGGVIDRDFDDQTFDNIQSLHVTDTHDLETMLIYSDSNILQRLSIAKSYGIVITREQANTAKRLSLQMGWLRMAVNILPFEEKRWIYLPKWHKQGRIDYALIHDNGNLDINQFLHKINDRQLQDDQKSEEQLRILKSHIISTSVLKKHITSDGKWCNISYDAYDALEVWRVINGHDYLGFLKCIVPRAEKAYRSNYRADNALEFDLIKAYDVNKFKSTHLYHSMNQCAFIE